MARPRYENAETLAAERAVIEKLCAGRGRTWEKLKEKYAADYLIMQGDTPTALAEVKCRTCRVGDFGTYMISAHKYALMENYAQSMKIRAVLAVQWSDALGYVEIPSAAAFPGIGGRKDRGDDHDREPVMHIPISAFVLV